MWCYCISRVPPWHLSWKWCPFSACFGTDKEKLYCKTTGFYRMKISLPLRILQRGKNPTLNWFQLSFLTCKQVLVLSYTQSTIPGVSHILSLHHLVPCWLEEWHLAWHGHAGSPGCWHPTSICWNVGKSELPQERWKMKPDATNTEGEKKPDLIL